MTRLSGGKRPSGVVTGHLLSLIQHTRAAAASSSAPRPGCRAGHAARAGERAATARRPNDHEIEPARRAHRAWSGPVRRRVGNWPGADGTMGRSGSVLPRTASVGRSVQPPPASMFGQTAPVLLSWAYQGASRVCPNIESGGARMRFPAHAFLTAERSKPVSRPTRAAARPTCFRSIDRPKNRRTEP